MSREGAIVLLHGRGADEHDLLPLLDMLDPGAPAVGHDAAAGRCTCRPGGKHWYAVHRIGFPDPATFTPTYAARALLDALPEALGVPWERTVLGGFSQGGVMSYALGLGPAPAPGGHPRASAASCRP